MRLSKAILEAACAWQVRIGDEQATPADLAEFEAWLDADPRHVAASQRIFSGAGMLAAAHLYRSAHRTPPPAADRRAIGAALVAAAVAIGFGLSTSAQTAYATAIGERKTVVLDDGSTVILNTDTALSIQFSGAVRRIALRRGEAFFNVARDPERPFIVDAGGKSVRAVGTRFAVRADSAAFSVLVVEGAVDLSTAHARARSPLTDSLPVLAAGQLLDSATARAPITLSPSEIERRLAWRTGWVVFDGQPLSHAAREISRYTGVRFVIDPRVPDEPITAHFRTDRLHGFLKSVPNFEKLEIERRGNEIHVRLRPEAME